MLKSIQIRNLLSFGPDSEPLNLASLNVLIGPNGSGKSNLIEVLGLLQALPTDLAVPIRYSGILDWPWKGKMSPPPEIRVTIEDSSRVISLNHHLTLIFASQFEVAKERIEDATASQTSLPPFAHYGFEFGHPVLREGSNRSGDLKEQSMERVLDERTFNREQSILAQLKDPERYPILSFLQFRYSHIAIYREWTFGRNTASRRAQPADLPNDVLRPNGENLALVLNRILPKSKARLLRALRNLYAGIQDIHVQVDGGRVQLFLQEDDRLMPATRLSDGTLRYLSLLAILCHPEPPSLICIEEPELGLHPDVLPEIARLLVEASARTQLIITTHSDTLVDALNEHPETVIVCEKHDGATQMRRLNSDELTSWLEKYSLGRLWRMGEIGGNRW